MSIFLSNLWNSATFTSWIPQLNNSCGRLLAAGIWCLASDDSSCAWQCVTSGRRDDMGNNERRYDLGEAIRRLKEWFAANVKWFTRTALFLLAAFIIVHQFNP